jgi:hypothetical protein
VPSGSINNYLTANGWKDLSYYLREI